MDCRVCWTSSSFVNRPPLAPPSTTFSGGLVSVSQSPACQMAVKVVLPWVQKWLVPDNAEASEAKLLGLVDFLENKVGLLNVINCSNC